MMTEGATIPLLVPCPFSVSILLMPCIRDSLNDLSREAPSDSAARSSGDNTDWSSLTVC